MSGDDVLTRTVVTAYFDDLYICYDEETEVVLAIAVLGEGGNAYSTNEFFFDLVENDYPTRLLPGAGTKARRGLSAVRL